MTLFYEPPLVALSPNLITLSLIAVDGSFGLEASEILGTQVIKLEYFPVSGGFGQNRIEALTVMPSPVVVSSVNSTYTLPDDSPITRYGAAVLFNGGVQILVWDQQACNGAGYFFCGPGETPIPAPATTLVAHELSHAFHNAIGDAPANDNQKEAQAITDENLHRQQLGLPVRDPGNHRGGCGAGTESGCNEIDCFMVTAATGSPRSPQVRWLADLRDRSLEHTFLGQLVFDQLFLEYYQVSARIAADMRRSVNLKASIARLIVDPLLTMLATAERWLRGDDDPVDEEFVSLLATTHAWLGDRAEARLPVISRLIGELAHNGDTDRADELSRDPDEEASRDDVLTEVKTTLAYLRRIARDSTVGTTYLAWAMFLPVEAYWSTMANLSASQGGLTAGLHKWLAAMPLPPEYSTAQERVVRRDLAWLAGQVVAPEARAAFGRRMLSAYGASVGYDLAHVLDDTGFRPEQPPRGGA
jgi:hypothetical protein